MFLTKVKYTKQLDNGAYKRVIESYLFAVSTDSFTECETRVYKELREQIRGEFIITKMDRFQVHDILGHPDNETKDKWFLAKLDHEGLDDDEQSYRAVKLRFLINDNDIQGAKDNLNEFIQETYHPNVPQLKSIAETPIIDYFPYSPEDAEADQD